MQNHQLIKLLGNFDRGKMTRFEEFAHSPYHNKHRGVRHLVNYLSTKFPNFRHKNLSKAALLTYFQYFAPFAHFNQQKLAVVFSYTISLLRDFFRHEEFKFGGSNEFLLYKHLRKNNEIEYYERWLSKNQGRHLAYGGDRQLQHMLYHRELNEFYNQFRSRENHHHFLKKQQMLDEFFLFEKLKDACEMQLRMQIFNVPNELNFVEKAVKQIEEKPEEYFHNPGIFIYFNIHKLLNVKTLMQYKFSLKYIKENEEKLPESELENIYNYLQNFCIQRINEGESDYQKRLFEIYKTQLEQRLILAENQLPEEHYKNIVTLGLWLNEHDWIHSFILNYKDKLSPIIRENAFTYNLANYYFSTGQFEEVLKLLAQVEYTEVRYNLGAKILLLKAFFELEEEEAFLSLCTSFKQYLRRNRQIHESTKKRYLNLIKFTKKVFQLFSKQPFMKRPKLKGECEKLKLEIEKEAMVFNKNWILKKVTA